MWSGYLCVVGCPDGLLVDLSWGLRGLGWVGVAGVVCFCGGFAGGFAVEYGFDDCRGGLVQ